MANSLRAGLPSSTQRRRAITTPCASLSSNIMQTLRRRQTEASTLSTLQHTTIIRNVSTSSWKPDWTSTKSATLGRTALHSAANHGSNDVVWLLVEKGAGVT